MKAMIIAAVAALGMSAAQASIVSNGGFENGMNGWSVSTPSGWGGSGNEGAAAYEGSNFFYGFNNNGYGSLQQTLVTDVGGTYQISLAFNTDGSAPPNSLILSVGDLNQVMGLSQGAWDTYSGQFIASSASTNLDLRFATTGGNGTVWVDAVTVEKVGANVPEPASLALFGLGLAGVAALRRRKA